MNKGPQGRVTEVVVRIGMRAGGRDGDIERSASARTWSGSVLREAVKSSLKGESSAPESTLPLGVLVAPRTGDAATPDSRGCGESAAAVEPMPAGITGSHCHSTQEWSGVAVSTVAPQELLWQRPPLQLSIGSCQGWLC